MNPKQLQRANGEDDADAVIEDECDNDRPAIVELESARVTVPGGLAMFTRMELAVLPLPSSFSPPATITSATVAATMTTTVAVFATSICGRLFSFRYDNNDASDSRSSAQPIRRQQQNDDDDATGVAKPRRRVKVDEKEEGGGDSGGVVLAVEALAPTLSSGL